MQPRSFNIREEERIAPEAASEDLGEKFSSSIGAWALSFGNRDDSCYEGAVAIRADVDGPTEVRNALLHPQDANSGTDVLDGHASAVILNFKDYVVVIAIHANGSVGAIRVAMDVCETFLDYTEYCDFQLARQASQVRLNIEIHRDIAARSKPFDEPPQSRFQPGLL
jgi:hypothetical protein